MNAKDRDGLAELTRACNAADGTKYAAALDADLVLLSRSKGKIVSALCVYFLGETRKKRDVAEFVMLTHPDYRLRGRMRRLMRRFEEYIDDGAEGAGTGDVAGSADSAVSDTAAPIRRFSAYPSEVSASFLTHIGALHVYDECLMELTPAKENRTAAGSACALFDSTEGAKTENCAAGQDPVFRYTIEEAEEAEEPEELEKPEEPEEAEEAVYGSVYEEDPDGSLHEKPAARTLHAENAYSECGVFLQGRQGFLHSVRTDRNHLRKGSAEALIRKVIALLVKENLVDTLALHVSSENRPAVGLYRKLGFRVSERLEIWYSE